MPLFRMENFECHLLISIKIIITMRPGKFGAEGMGHVRYIPGEDYYVVDIQ